MVRAAVPPEPADRDPRVRRGDPAGAGAAGSGRAGGPFPLPPVRRPGRHRARQAVEADHPPAEGLAPRPARCGGPEEHRADGGDRGRLAAAVLVTAASGRLRGLADRAPGRLHDRADGPRARLRRRGRGAAAGEGDARLLHRRDGPRGPQLPRRPDGPHGVRGGGTANPGAVPPGPQGGGRTGGARRVRRRDLADRAARPHRGAAGAVAPGPGDGPAGHRPGPAHAAGPGGAERLGAARGRRPSLSGLSSSSASEPVLAVGPVLGPGPVLGLGPRLSRTTTGPARSPAAPRRPPPRPARRPAPAGG